MQRLSSSYREVPPKETLACASQFAAKLGVSRVTNITRLDCIGIPVFASIRPGAVVGSLCVNAGKGVLEEEAKVGAFMEAIEFAMAEDGASLVPVLQGSARNVLDGNRRVSAVLDFCPLIGSQVDLDLPMSVVEAEEIFSQSSTFIPAKLVFLPFKDLKVQDSIFPSDSNGLASGNSVMEATVHGLFEVIERDISSFQLVRDTSILVIPESLPEPAASLAKVIHAAGLLLHVRFVPNDFNLAYFCTTLFDPYSLSPLYLNGGFGCHVDPSVALTRAICEAVQSRLSFIHGARDDLQIAAARFASWDEKKMQDYVEQRMYAASNPDRITKFEDITLPVPAIETLPKLLRFTLEALWSNGMRHVCRVVLTTDSDPVQVVRVLVPRMENFSESSKRIGVRLRDYVNRL